MSSRRRFLVRIGTFAGGAVGLAVLQGCGAGGASTEEIQAEAKRYAGDLDCSVAEGLWPAEAQTRVVNKYVDRSPEPREFCFRCTNYVAPVETNGCATCKTVKGPVHPLGWCESWTEKA